MNFLALLCSESRGISKSNTNVKKINKEWSMVVLTVYPWLALLKRDSVRLSR